MKKIAVVLFIGMTIVISYLVADSTTKEAEFIPPGPSISSMS